MCWRLFGRFVPAGDCLFRLCGLGCGVVALVIVCFCGCFGFVVLGCFIVLRWFGLMCPEGFICFVVWVGVLLLSVVVIVGCLVSRASVCCLWGAVVGVLTCCTWSA